jgi:hypothetical protein
MKIKLMLYGAIIYASIQSLSQDLMGKANYLKVADAAWIDWKITVPIVALALLLVVTDMPKGEVMEQS